MTLYSESNFAAPDHWNSLFLLQFHCTCLVLLHCDFLVTSSPSTLEDFSTRARDEDCLPLYSQILASALIHFVTLYLLKAYQVPGTVWGAGNRNMYQTENTQNKLTKRKKKQEFILICSSEDIFSLSTLSLKCFLDSYLSLTSNNLNIC